MKHIYTLKELLDIPTIIIGQTCNLKVENFEADMRIWLSRCTVEDGEPFNNKVTIEQFIDGQWVITATYQAQ